jgi:hypothetical protein
LNTYIPLILTTIVTLSTIFTRFALFSRGERLRRQPRFPGKLLWAELNRYLEILRQQDAPETAFMQKLSDLILEFMIANLLTNAIEKNDQDFEEFRRKVSALVSENETDALKTPWVARLAEQRRRH